jgi:hypothetical protein
MENDIQCPVDFVVINENKARITAFFVLVLSTVFLVTGLWVVIVFLVLDFFLRANNWGKYSLLAILSDGVISQLKIRNKSTDRAPKKFAAGVGLLFTIGAFTLNHCNCYYNYSTSAFRFPGIICWVLRRLLCL